MSGLLKVFFTNFLRFISISNNFYSIFKGVLETKITTGLLLLYKYIGIYILLFFFFLLQRNDSTDTKLKLRHGKGVLHGAPSGAMDLVFPRRLQFLRRHRYDDFYSVDRDHDTAFTCIFLFVFALFFFAQEN